MSPTTSVEPKSMLLDIDEDVLTRVREIALAEGKTEGRVLSELCRQTIADRLASSPHDFPVGMRIEDGLIVRPR